MGYPPDVFDRIVHALQELRDNYADAMFLHKLHEPSNRGQAYLAICGLAKSVRAKIDYLSRLGCLGFDHNGLEGFPGDGTVEHTQTHSRLRRMIPILTSRIEEQIGAKGVSERPELNEDTLWAIDHVITIVQRAASEKPPKRVIEPPSGKWVTVNDLASRHAIRKVNDLRKLLKELSRGYGEPHDKCKPVQRRPSGNKNELEYLDDEYLANVLSGMGLVQKAEPDPSTEK